MSHFDSLASIPPERRWHNQTMPAPVVVAIVCQETPDPQGQTESRYLLIRRVAEPYRGRWALVGGKWDFGETLANAAVREVLEETGLEVRFVALRGIVSERMTPVEPDGSGAAHFLLLVCQVDVQNGEASEQQEGVVTWFSAGEIEDLHLNQRIIPSDYVMLQRFANAPEIPLFEAEMVSAPAAGGPEPGSFRLARFEKAG